MRGEKKYWEEEGAPKLRPQKGGKIGPLKKFLRGKK